MTTPTTPPSSPRLLPLADSHNPASPVSAQALGLLQSALRYNKTTNPQPANFELELIEPPMGMTGTQRATMLRSLMMKEDAERAEKRRQLNAEREKATSEGKVLEEVKKEDVDWKYVNPHSLPVFCDSSSAQDVNESKRANLVHPSSASLSPLQRRANVAQVSPAACRVVASRRCRLGLARRREGPHSATQEGRVGRQGGSRVVALGESEALVELRGGEGGREFAQIHAHLCARSLHNTSALRRRLLFASQAKTRKKSLMDVQKEKMNGHSCA